MGVKNKEAFLQAVYLGKRGLNCLNGGIGTDRDLRLHYVNGIDQLLEFKKDTKAHSIEYFSKTPQFLLQKKDADALRAYFLYCVHNEPINKDIIINADVTVVKYAYYKFEALKYYCGLYLVHVQEDLKYLYDDNFTYYIKVTYPNKDTKYCKTGTLLNKAWIANTKEETQKFKTYKDAFNYVHDRFYKGLNKANTGKNKYAIYRTCDDELVCEYAYNQDKETLSITREPKSKILSSSPLDIN